jgi:hypothetical protein
MTNIKESMIQNMVRQMEVRIKAKRDMYGNGDKNSLHFKYEFYQDILDRWMIMDFRERKIRILLMHMYDKEIHVDDINYNMVVSPCLVGKLTSWVISLNTNIGLGTIFRLKPGENYYLLNGNSKMILKNYGDYITDFLDFYNEKRKLEFSGGSSV